MSPLQSERLPLRFLATEPVVARLREPQGADELGVTGIDTRSAVTLLCRLVQGLPAEADGKPMAADQLAACDRDALLAALHRMLWGDRIVSSLTCAACGALYDLAFELSAVQRQLGGQSEAVRVRRPRCIESRHGEHWTLPDAAAEEAAALHGDAAQRLLASVTGSDSDASDRAAVAERLDTLAPLIDIDLSTECAECGAAQRARFDVQSFVMQRLLDERETVLREVHLLASGYGWSWQEIAGLPRSLRRSLVRQFTAKAESFG